MIEAEAARLRGAGFSALNEVLGKQGLALDAIFTQLTRETVEGYAGGYQALHLALRAHSQSRATLVSLVPHARGRKAARRTAREKISTSKVLQTGIFPHDQAVGAVKS